MMIMKGEKMDYTKMDYTKEYIRSQLQHSVMNVKFTKTDGTVREMVCTLLESLAFYEKKTDKQKPENNDVLAVWDIEKHAWRSFRVDSIISADVVKVDNV